MTNLSAGDAVIFDTEIWPGDLATLLYYNHNGILNPADHRGSARYTGDSVEKNFEQYINYRGERGNDLVNVVKQKDRNIKTLFYGENIPSSFGYI